jgi:hypothetical protein
MDVKEFIESTLVQIVEGINNANEKLKDTGAVISSKNVRPTENGATTINVNTGDLVNFIDYDVAVTVKEKNRANGGASVMSQII